MSRKPGDWMCPNCNFLIWASKSSCKKCGAKKPGSGSGYGSGSSGKYRKGGKRGGKRGGGKSKGSDWICSTCSTSNFPDRMQCRSCKTGRVAVAVPSVPSVPAVSAPLIVDDAKKDNVDKKFKKKKGKKIKKGGTGSEWTCSNCSTSNYSDRDKCRKCKQDKPDDDNKDNDDNDNDDNDDDFANEGVISTDKTVKVNIDIEMKINEELALLQANNKIDIDLVFLMDCTGSMGSYINAGKEAIKSICSKLKNDNNNVNNINFGYVAYRDQPKSEKTFITKVFPLTNDINKMSGYINTYSASGGGDGPEALTEALYDSLNKINYNNNNIKVNVLICDAPGHGWKCTSYDNYPNGNPNGYDPIKICYDMAKKGIILYALGCEPSISNYKYAKDILEGMSKITEGYYLPLTNADLLPDIILNSLKQEINLKYIEKYIINMMIKYRLNNINANCDENILINNLDMNVIKKLKMNNKIQCDNVYNGDYDYTNINLIKNTFNDINQQNIKFVINNIKKDIVQPKIKKYSNKSKFDMKSGDWNCTKCHYMNFANRWFCRTCNNVNHTLRNGDWFCSKCSDINYGKNKVCRKCKVTKKPLNGPHIIIKVKDNDDQKQNKQKINALSCNVNNDIFDVVINRIKKQNRFHDWKCKSCKYINFEANVQCRRCNTAKPSNNFGDWKCPNNSCKYMNFGSRTNCRECNTSKPN